MKLKSKIKSGQRCNIQPEASSYHEIFHSTLVVKVMANFCDIGKVELRCSFEEPCAEFG